MLVRQFIEALSIIAWCCDLRELLLTADVTGQLDQTDNKLSTRTVYLGVSEPSEVGVSKLPRRHAWTLRSRDLYQRERLGTAFPNLFWQWEQHLNQFQVNCTKTTPFAPKFAYLRLENTQIFLLAALKLGAYGASSPQLLTLEPPVWFPNASLFKELVPVEEGVVWCWCCVDTATCPRITGALNVCDESVNSSCSLLHVNMLYWCHACRCVHSVV